LAADRLRGRRMSRAVTAGIGVGRVALSAAVLVRPASLPAALGVDSVTARRTGWVVRMFAARDAALGLGAVWAVATGERVRPWLVAQAIGDATDAAVFALAARERHVSPARGLALSALAASGVVGGLAAARDADLPS